MLGPDGLGVDPDDSPGVCPDGPVVDSDGPAVALVLRRERGDWNTGLLEPVPIGSILSWLPLGTDSSVDFARLPVASTCEDSGRFAVELTSSTNPVVASWGLTESSAKVAAPSMVLMLKYQHKREKKQYGSWVHWCILYPSMIL